MEIRGDIVASFAVVSAISRFLALPNWMFIKLMSIGQGGFVDLGL